VHRPGTGPEVIRAAVAHVGSRSNNANSDEPLATA
jgi:hypothetical protein